MLQAREKWGGKGGNCPLLIMIKGQDVYFAPLLKFKKRILSRLEIKKHRQSQSGTAFVSLSGAQVHDMLNV